MLRPTLERDETIGRDPMKRLLLFALVAAAAWYGWKHQNELRHRGTHEIVVMNNSARVLERVRISVAGQGQTRSLLFIAFAAEEIGCIGSRSWIFDAEVTGELKRIKGIVNLDCIAHGDRFELMASPQALSDRLSAI